MSTWLRMTSLLTAAAVTVVFAVHLSAFLERDACLDAGGRYVESTGACDVDGADYVALFARAHLYGFWGVFLGLCFSLGWVADRVLFLVLASRSAASPTQAGEKPPA